VAISLKFEHPHFPEGHPFAINYLGQVLNGESVEVNEENERAFIASHGVTVEDAFKNDALVSVSGSSSLSNDESNQLLEQASFRPVETAPQAQTDVENDPNALINNAGGENA